MLHETGQSGGIAYAAEDNIELRDFTLGKGFDPGRSGETARNSLI
jgi:hypothetical protein